MTTEDRHAQHRRTTRLVSRPIWLIGALVILLLPAFAAPALAAAPQVAPAFRLYYARYHGLRVLGYPLGAAQQQDCHRSSFSRKRGSKIIAPPAAPDCGASCTAG